MKYIFYLLILMMMFSGVAFSQNLISFPVGDEWRFPDSRTLGMGGAGSVSNSSPAALMLNPAALSLSSGGLHLSVSGNVRNLEERRSFPVFNRFDDIIENGIYVVNDNWFMDLQSGAQYGLNWASFPYLKSIAVGVFEEVDQNYEYVEEVRANDFDAEQSVLAYNEIHLDGRLQRVSLGAGLQFRENLNLGFQVGFLTAGDVEKERSVEFVESDTADIDEFSTRSPENTPFVASFGAIYDINPYLSVGSHLRLPYTVEYQLTGNSLEQPFMESIEYPLQWNVGFEYRGQQPLEARLNVDFAYEWWGNTESTIQSDYLDVSFDDAIFFKVGIEHMFHNKIPFQVGLQYRTAFQQRSDTRTIITAGTGIRNDFWEVNVAGGFSKLSYTFRDLFSDEIFGGERTTEFDDVEERYFFAMLTLNVQVR